MNDHDYFLPADGNQQQFEAEEAERERWETSMDALARAQELGLEEMYLRHLAFECGVKFAQIGKEKAHA